MPSIETQRKVPAGAIAAAMTMVESLHGRDVGRPVEEVTADFSAAVGQWGKETMTDAFGSIIRTTMDLITPKPGAPDNLHTVVPAVVTRLRRARLREVPDAVLPTVAGVLTAAHFKLSPYEWRSDLGPLGSSEPVVWCYTAWLLVDLVDETVFQAPGRFAELLGDLLSRDDVDLDGEPPSWSDVRGGGGDSVRPE